MPLSLLQHGQHCSHRDISAKAYTAASALLDRLGSDEQPQWPALKVVVGMLKALL